MNNDPFFIDFSDKISLSKEKKTLNKPFRTPDGPKKFSVYVKNEKGNIVKVNFGDPNMEIKRDDPDRRKNFRARHNCDNPGPKTKARYWSCKQWRAGTKVQGSDSDEYQWDGETFFDHDDLLKINPDLAFAEEEKEKEETTQEEDDCCGQDCGCHEEKSKAALSEKQKKLPPALQKAILKKKGKKPEEDSEEKEEKSEDEKDEKSEKPSKGLSDKQKKLPPALQKAILKKQRKASDEPEEMKEKYASLWKNIHEKRKRIKSGSGEKMRKKGDKGAPTPEQLKKAKSKSEEDEKVVLPYLKQKKTADADYDDHEISMAESQLKKISQQSALLAMMMSRMPEDANLMAWVQDKISKAEHMIGAAYDYMVYKNSNASEVSEDGYDMSFLEFNQVMTFDEIIDTKNDILEEEQASEESFSAKRRGPKSSAQTPAKPSERRKGSSKNKKGSAGKSGPAITFSAKVTESLKNKVKEHNAKSRNKVTLSQLKKVYRRGAGAFSSSHRPGKTRGQWAMARVNMFLKMKRGGKVKKSYRAADGDI